MCHRYSALVIAFVLMAHNGASAQDTPCAPPGVVRRLTGIGALFPDESYATAVTEFGRVIGVSTVRVAEVIDFRGFSWTRSRGMLDLTTQTGPMNTPAGINLNGQIVGSAWVGGYQHVLLFTPGVGTIDLTPGPVQASAADLNELGDVAATFLVNGVDRAHYYSTATGWIDIGTLGGRSSRAYRLNNRGVVVGESVTASGGRRAFVWSRKHGLRDLGDEPAAAYGINDRGRIVGVRDGRAVMWRPDGSVRELGMVSEFDLGSTALDINELSQVVGIAYPGSSFEEHAFLWTPATGMVDLGALGGETCNAGATRINNAGQVVGWSRTPPTPEPYPFRQAVVWDIALTPREQLASRRAIMEELRLARRARRVHADERAPH